MFCFDLFCVCIASFAVVVEFCFVLFLLFPLLLISRNYYSRVFC